MSHEIEDGEVAIVIRPDIDEDGTWNGGLKTGLVFGPTKDEAATRSAMDLALTMAATMQVLDEYPDLFEYFDEAKVELVKEMFPEHYKQSTIELEKEMNYTTEGNVIKLTKWTKTMGEA